MTGPLLYRSPPRWQLWAYIGAAVFIHFAAVVVAGIKTEPEPIDLSAIPDAVVVAMEETQPAEPEPTPPPEEIPPPEPPPMPMAEPEFKEEQSTPPPKTQTRTKPVAPIQAPKPAGPAAPPGSAAKAYMLSRPNIAYPYEARKSRTTGTGTCLLSVDSSGNVTDASMAKSTGSPILDNSITSGLQRARFKPGTPPKVKQTVTFTLTGAQY